MIYFFGSLGANNWNIVEGCLPFPVKLGGFFRAYGVDNGSCAHLETCPYAQSGSNGYVEPHFFDAVVQEHVVMRIYGF